MAAQIELYNDIVNNRLVQGINSNSAFTFGTLFQGSTLSIRYFPLVPIWGAVTAPFYKKVSLANITALEMALGPRAGAESLLAYQGTWTAQSAADSDGVSGYMYADFDLNVSALNTAIGNSDSAYSTYFEIRLSESGKMRPTYQTSIGITPVVLGPGAAGSAPTPAASYFTKEEAMNLFVKWYNGDLASRGKGITLFSPDGASTREIGVNNDKSAKDELT